MPAVAKHRAPIIDAAIRLFRKRGYPGTGLNDIVRASGAPKGSLYYYFPGGKASIAVAATEEAGRRMAQTMAEIAETTTSAEAFVERFAKTLGGWMRQSGYRDGCPMTTVLLELAPDDRHIAKAGRRAYDARLRVIADVLERDGIDAETAGELACLWMAALNGALIEARVRRSVRPLSVVAARLAEGLGAHRG